MSCNVGDIILDKYKVQEIPSKSTGLLGSGAYGFVCYCIDITTGNPCAVKSEHRNIEDLRQIIDFIDISRCIVHPSIIKLVDYNVALNEDESSYILLTVYPIYKSSNTIDDVYKIESSIFHLLQGLYYLEKNRICHNDIKPDNILWTDDGSPVLIDLGLAKRYQTDKLYINWNTSSPAYRSPWAIKLSPLDSRADQWSLGATIFQYIDENLLLQYDQDTTYVKLVADKTFYKQILKDPSYAISENDIDWNNICSFIPPAIDQLNTSMRVKNLLHVMLNPNNTLTVENLLNDYVSSSPLSMSPMIPSTRSHYLYPLTKEEINKIQKKSKFIKRFHEDFYGGYSMTDMLKKYHLIEIIQFLHFYMISTLKHDSVKDIHFSSHTLFELDGNAVNLDIHTRRNALELMNHPDIDFTYHFKTLFDFDPIIDIDKYYTLVLSGDIMSLTFDEALALVK